MTLSRSGDAADGRLCFTIRILDSIKQRYCWVGRPRPEKSSSLISQTGWSPIGLLW
jgi:hypothetical protein